MIGIIVELIISFLLLKYVASRNIEVLGLKPDKVRIAQLFLGILWPIAFYCFYEYCMGYLVHNPYRINPNYQFADFISSIAYLVRTVGYEEPIFRGAILYILIQKIGGHKAVLISAAAFGIYHWFAWQAFGNLAQMLIIFLSTATGGFMFAMAYRRTGSMYLQCGLHFGCDFATMLVFSKNKTIGLQWLVKSFVKDPVVPGAIVSIIVLIIHFVGFQVLTYWMLKRLPVINSAE